MAAGPSKELSRTAPIKASYYEIPDEIQKIRRIIKAYYRYFIFLKSFKKKDIGEMYEALAGILLYGLLFIFLMSLEYLCPFLRNFYLFIIKELRKEPDPIEKAEIEHLIDQIRQKVNPVPELLSVDSDQYSAEFQCHFSEEGPPVAHIDVSAFTRAPYLEDTDKQNPLIDSNKPAKDQDSESNNSEKELPKDQDSESDNSKKGLEGLQQKAKVNLDKEKNKLQKDKNFCLGSN